MRGGGAERASCELTLETTYVWVCFMCTYTHTHTHSGRAAEHQSLQHYSHASLLREKEAGDFSSRITKKDHKSILEVVCTWLVCYIPSLLKLYDRFMWGTDWNLGHISKMLLFAVPIHSNMVFLPRDILSYLLPYFYLFWQSIFLWCFYPIYSNYSEKSNQYIQRK